jgi:Amt family ammonium transporter
MTLSLFSNKTTELTRLLTLFFYKGGSEMAINSRAGNAVVVSNLAAASGGLTWMFVEMIKNRKKQLSLKGFCCGAISGLVAITPASGYVRPHYALVFGVLGAVACLYACDINKLTKFKYDDTCDVFGGTLVFFLQL